MHFFNEKFISDGDSFWCMVAHNVVGRSTTVIAATCTITPSFCFLFQSFGQCDHVDYLKKLFKFINCFHKICNVSQTSTNVREEMKKYQLIGQVSATLRLMHFNLKNIFLVQILLKKLVNAS